MQLDHERYLTFYQHNTHPLSTVSHNTARCQSKCPTRSLYTAWRLRISCSSPSQSEGHFMESRFNTRSLSMDVILHQSVRFAVILAPALIAFLRLNPLTADFSLYQGETWRPSYPTCQTVYLFRPSSSQEPTTRKYASSQATHLQPSPNPGWHFMAGPYRNAKPPQHPSQRNSNQEFAS